MLTYLYYGWVIVSSIVTFAVTGVIALALLDWWQWKKKMKIVNN